jgi:hypothetical protein
MARDNEELEIRRRLDACFNLQIDRDCENCLAHGDYDGPCCFGKKFDEYDEEDCAKCPHHDDCAEECGYELFDPDDTVRIGPKGDRVQPLGPPIKPSIWDRLRTGSGNLPATPVVTPSKFTLQARTGAVPPNAPRTSTALTTQPQTTIKEGEYRYIPMDNRVPIGDGNPDESAGSRFVKDSVWGGGEGFFRSAYEFFRTHRLR